MPEFLFYHLERARLDDVLPDLLEKTLQRGWRAIVRTRDAERAAFLDDLLWRAREESFLPHAAGGTADFAARQPIWITVGDDVPNAAHVLFLVDGSMIEAAAAESFERCVVIFDGEDAAALDGARNLWRAVKAREAKAAYWRFQNGRWAQQT